MAGSRAHIRTVRHHRVPAWWRDAKLGIFVHWTPASVPAFAPVDHEIGDLLARRHPQALAWSPYAEWYENSLRFPDSPAARFHAEHYPGRPYRSFIPDWEAGLAHWDPDRWAATFATTGARYVVLVAKHHDGYCLWPTDVPNPHRPGFHSSRDVVGELAAAVRARGMRFGVYYSGGLDWTFNDHPIGSFGDLVAAQPRGHYVDYAEAHLRELIDRYRPSVLWNDISWPGTVRQLAGVLADYYQAVPDGVVNDRFMPWSPLWELAKSKPGRRMLDSYSARGAAAAKGLVPPKPPLFDVRTPEYAVFDRVQALPWECVRGMDKGFGHNRLSSEEDFISRRDLLWSLTDIAAKGGNLLLNVGPRGEDASIADPQLLRLEWLATFTDAAGAGLFATRPWVHAQGLADDGVEVRYTARDMTVYAFLRSAGRDGQVVAPAARHAITLNEVRATPATEVTTLDGLRMVAEPTSAGLRVELGEALSGEQPFVLALRHVEAR
jgi:alpha-L-fucosidase